MFNGLSLGLWALVKALLLFIGLDGRIGLLRGFNSILRLVCWGLTGLQVVRAGCWGIACYYYGVVIS